MHVALAVFAGTTAFLLVYGVFAQVGFGLSPLEAGVTAMFVWRELEIVSARCPLPTRQAED